MLRSASSRFIAATIIVAHNRLKATTMPSFPFLAILPERYIGGMSVTSAFQDVIKEMSFEKFYAWVNKDYPVQCMEEHMINFFIERIRFTEKAKFLPK